ncbi:MAG: metallophosphoesterase family protein [Salibacteraceae bacterium]
MALYAIGDLHGSLTALKTLFHYQGFGAQDTLVFLGDYSDKGADTRGVIEFLLEQKQVLDLVFLKGNHDLMMAVARDHPERFEEWVFHGGQATLNSYGISKQTDWAKHIPENHWNFLETGLPYWEKDNFIFVHAGVQPDTPLAEQPSHILLWEKNFNPEPYAPNKTVICGHTARKNGQIANYGHTICIDTFAHGGQWLTCLEVTNGSYLQTSETSDFRWGSLNAVAEG